jgi:hypothetical protein
VTWIKGKIGCRWFQPATEVRANGVAARSSKVPLLRQTQDIPMYISFPLTSRKNIRRRRQAFSLPSGVETSQHSGSILFESRHCSNYSERGLSFENYTSAR